MHPCYLLVRVQVEGQSGGAARQQELLFQARSGKAPRGRDVAQLDHAVIAGAEPSLTPGGLGVHTEPVGPGPLNRDQP